MDISKKPIKIIQISDMHLHASAAAELLKVNTEESYKAVLALIEREEGSQPADLFVLSGDISQDASPASYERVADLLAPFNVPACWLPGNHDDVTVMSQVYPRGVVSNDKNIILNHWQIILLNSQIPRKVPGFLDDAQLRYLQFCLESHPNHHSMVFFHHHPVPVGSVWLDKLGIKNADQFWQMVAGFPNLKAVIFGHVHQEFRQEVNGVLVCSPPSTCIQFKPQQETFALDHQPPGYRRIELFDDGSIKTEVCRTDSYIGTFDKDAKGY